MNANPKQGYFVDFLEELEPTPTFSHTSCGPQQVKGAWCPNCDKPLLEFLNLDVTDNRLMLESSPFKRLRLLFCWTCNIAQSIFYYRIRSDDSISLLQFGKGGTEADFPYPNYPAYFPGRSVLLREIPDEVQRVLQEMNQGKPLGGFRQSELSPAVREMLNQLDRPKHQIGGEPYLSQDNPDDLLTCLNCQKVMPFFAAIGDDAPVQMRFTEDLDTQVLYFLFRECHIVGAYQQCS